MRRYNTLAPIPGPTVEHIADVPTGGCIVKCGFCGHEFHEEGLEDCPKCKNDIIFPNADW